MKLIYKAGDINEANIVSGMLRANGIETHVGGYYLQGGIGDLAAMDFANIYVADEDGELARTLIDEYENAATDNDPETQGRSNSNFILSVVLFLLMLIGIFYYFVR